MNRYKAVFIKKIITFRAIKKWKFLESQKEIQNNYLLQLYNIFEAYVIRNNFQGVE